MNPMNRITRYPDTAGHRDKRISVSVNRRTEEQGCLDFLTLHQSIALVSVALGVVVSLLLVAGCKQGGAGGKPENVEYYTCTMHPSVKSQDSKGKCPICGMQLVPVTKKGATTAHDHAVGMQTGASTNAPGATPVDAPTEFTVPVERQQQIGVT